MKAIRRLSDNLWRRTRVSAASLFLLLTCVLPALSAGTCTDFVADGGFEFEIDPYVPMWIQQSTMYGSPLCDAEMCGANLARTGAWWAWFGGTDGSIREEGSLEQSITLPSGGIIPLQFYLKTEESGAAGDSDFVRVTLDGHVLFSTTAADIMYQATEYIPVTLNLAAYANGSPHLLRFESVINSTTSFFVDDVSRPDKKFVNTSRIVNFADDLLQTVIDKTLPAQEIRGQVFDSKEDIVVDLDDAAAVVTLKGGYGCNFSEMAPGAMTTFRSLEIRSGKVIARNLVLKGSL